MAKNGRHPGRGFTLIEALLASVILAGAVIGITVPFSAGARSEQEDARKTLATALAMEMIEEIMTKSWVDGGGNAGPGPEPQEKKLPHGQFDCVDDYDGLSEAAGQITSCKGEVLTGVAAVGLSRNVSATYVLVSEQQGGSGNNGNGKKKNASGTTTSFLSVVVEVKYMGQPCVRLTRLLYSGSGV